MTSKIRKYIEWIAIGVLGISFFIIFTEPVYEGDIFWHLKTGQHIWENKEIPAKDPFLFTSIGFEPTRPDSVRIKFVLSSYWLAQIALYGIYSLADIAGVIIFRVLLLIAPLLIIWHWLRKRNVQFNIIFLVIALSGFVLREYTGDRPQLFSFLFAPLAVYLLEDLKNRLNSYNRLNRAKKAITLFDLLALFKLPSLMLLWANMHGGFILGAVIIGIYMAAEGLKAMYNKVKAKAEVEKNLNLNLFLPICLIAVFASFINPNTYKVVPLLLEWKTTLYKTAVIENYSPIQHALVFHQYHIPYFIFFALSAATLFLRILVKSQNSQRDHNYALCSAVIFLAALSLTASRYIPFFVLIGSAWVAIELNKGASFAGLFFRKIREFFIVELAIMLILGIILSSDIKNTTALKLVVAKKIIPENAVMFIKKNNISGRIFNTYEWGGYLTWTLYPQSMAFMDGRALVEEVFLDYKRVVDVDETLIAGIPYWKAILDAYNVDMFLISGVNFISFHVNPVIHKIVRDESWALVYYDDCSVLFLKKKPKFKEVILKYAMPSDWAYNQIIMKAQNGIKHMPWNPVVWITMADAHYVQGRYRAAKMYYQEALKHKPNDEALKKIIEKIEGMGY